MDYSKRQIERSEIDSAFLEIHEIDERTVYIYRNSETVISYRERESEREK